MHTTPATAPRPRKTSKSDGYMLELAHSEPAVQHAHIHWAYEGMGGPENWSKLDPQNKACAIGERQSPIDIKDGIKVDLEPIKFNYQPSTFRIIDNGHTVQVTLPGGGISLLGKSYQLLQLHFDGGDVTIDGLIQQAGLGRVEVFAAFAELPAFQDRQLVGELVNFGLAVQDVLVFAGDEFVALDNRPIPVCDLGNQGAGEFAQLLLAQTGNLLDIDHERQCGIHAPHWQSVQHPIDSGATVLNDSGRARFRRYG